MKFKSKEQVPAGVYQAQFLGCEDTDHPEYGPGVQWAWEITSGKFRGQKVFRTTKEEASKKNSLGKFLSMLCGKGFDYAKKIDTDDYNGVACQVVVTETESGSTRVESFIPAREPGADEDDADVNDTLDEAAAGEDSPFDE